MKRIGRAEFASGSLTLYSAKDINNEPVIENQEVVGKVEVHMKAKTFIRGIWVKLVAVNTIYSTSGLRELFTFNLLSNEEFFHLDGITEVFVGFGEGDEDNGSLLELNSGKYRFPFTIKLPKYTPPSYCDTNVRISYTLTACLDSPVIAINTSTVSYNLIVDGISELEARQMIENNGSNVLNVGKVLSSRPRDSDQHLINKMINFMRPPTYLTLQGLHSAAIFDFKTKDHIYEAKCCLYNVFSKQPFFIRAQLYVEITIRESINHTFIDDADSNLVPAHCNSTSTRNHTMKDSDLVHRYLLWNKNYIVNGDTDSSGSGSGSSAINGRNSEVVSTNLITGGYKHEVHLSFPVNIDSKLKKRNLKAWPNPVPLKYDMGEITSFSMEGPLFRSRVILKISAIKGTPATTISSAAANKLLCNPVYGEIFIAPTVCKPNPDLLVRSSSNGSLMNEPTISAVAAVATTTTAATAINSSNNNNNTIPAIPRGRRPLSAVNGSNNAIVNNTINSNGSINNSSSAGVVAIALVDAEEYTTSATATTSANNNANNSSNNRQHIGNNTTTTTSNASRRNNNSTIMSSVAPVSEISLPSTTMTPERHGGGSRRNSRTNNNNNNSSNNSNVASSAAHNTIDTAMSRVMSGPGSRPPVPTVSNNNISSSSNNYNIGGSGSAAISSSRRNSGNGSTIVMLDAENQHPNTVNNNNVNNNTNKQQKSSKTNKTNKTSSSNTSHSSSNSHNVTNPHQQTHAGQQPQAYKIVTPHAKPTNFAIKVDAEIISRGPAAALYDRNNANHVTTEITTPGRFAPIYRLGEAVVIPGTPLYNISTPNIISISSVFNSTVNTASRFDDLVYATPRTDTTVRNPGSGLHTGEVVPMTPVGGYGGYNDRGVNAGQSTTPVVLQGSRLFV